MILPVLALQNHTAVLGKTGSGKSSTAKLIVEQVVAGGARVCILDPIKSDWWGLISSADGKHPGLPFHILGGPRGHVPLHERAGKAIAEIVATGALPLSIIDMADFGPGGQAQFFTDFAPVLIRRMRGVIYLVIEEAHLFAPKERSGVGQENMAIHWAKTLATAGRSKGIRLLLATQRIQALHNALLGSCETLIALRLTIPADQEPVMKWLKANAPKDVTDKIAAELGQLPTGTGWICSGEARIFERRAFPRTTTFDNTKTPTGGDAELSIKTAAVDQERLRAIIGDAVKEAEANDPRLLKKRIAELERQAPAQSPALSAAERQEIADANFKAGWAAAAKQIGDALEDGLQRLERVIHEMRGPLADTARVEQRVWAGMGVAPAPTIATPKASVLPKPSPHDKQIPVSDGITPALQKVLDAVAWWRKIGQDPADRKRACVVAGFSPKASTFGVYVSQLVQKGLLTTEPGKVSLTATGVAAANHPTATTRDDLRQMARALLSPQEQKTFDVVYEAWPKDIRRDAVAAAVGLSTTASTAGVYLSAVAAYGLILPSGRGTVRAADWLFP